MSVKRIGDGRYFVRVRHRLPSGGMSSKSKTVVGDKAAALRAEAEMRISAEKEGKNREKYSFKTVIAEYRRRTKADLTRAEFILKRLEFDLGNATEETMRDRWEKFMAILEVEKSEFTLNRYSVATLNRHFAYASAAIGVAVRFGHWKSNPLRVFSKRKEVPRDRTLSAAETTELLKQIREKHRHILPAVQFAMLVPIRKSELVGMLLQDVDQVGMRVRIHNGTTKNGRGVWVPIPPQLIEYFRSIPPESPTVFYRKRGNEFVSLGDFKKAWMNALSDAKIEKFRFHDLRHQAATAMVNAGVPERIVRAVANWKTDMLRRYYSFDSMEACRQIESIWKESGAGGLKVVNSGEATKEATGRAV